MDARAGLCGGSSFEPENIVCNSFQWLHAGSGPHPDS
jgi:hypothetical protein